MFEFNYQTGVPGMGRNAVSSVELIDMLKSLLLRMAFSVWTVLENGRFILIFYRKNYSDNYTICLADPVNFEPSG